MKMKDSELTTIVEHLVSDSVSESGSYRSDNEEWLKRYKAEPFGDEVDGRSSVVSTDTRDMVESDMPALARIFMGAGDTVEFWPVNESPEAWQEARDKQAVVRHIRDNIPEQFRLRHTVYKAALIQNVSALEYGCREETTTKTKRYSGISDEELTAVIEAMKADPNVADVDVSEVSDDADEYDVEITVKYTKKKYFLSPVSSDDLIISRNATCKEDAEVIGKRFKKTRGQLIAEGFSKKLVESLPNVNTGRQGGIKSIRYQEQGGETTDQASYQQWAMQEVDGYDVYAMIDYDDDGIAERRHIVCVGTKVLVNEAFDHVPYALYSSMLDPYNIIGTPRAELTKQYDKINTVLWRQTLDNMYSTNAPRIGYRGDVNVDHLLDIQFNGVIDMGSDGEITPVVIPYIGDKALQVVAFMEGKKAASTGVMQSNQALDADNLHKETATRFEGMHDSGAAKLELVARVFAETGEKELWEGLAWFAEHYQDTEMELQVLGRPMTFNPSTWKYDHVVRAKVGTGAGDNEKSLQNLMALYQLQTAEIEKGSMLADHGKAYNTLAEIVKLTGRNAVQQYFNDPSRPDEMVMAERDILRQQVTMMEQQLQQANPLAEAEQVKAQAAVQMQQLKHQYEGQLEMLKLQNANEQKLTDLRAKYQSDLAKVQIDMQKHTDRLKFDYAKLMTDQGNTVGEVENAMAALSDQELLAIAMGKA